jgi:hypothetical protein
MRVVIAIALLAIFLSLGGCSRRQYADPRTEVSAPVPHVTKASWTPSSPHPSVNRPKTNIAMPPSSGSSAALVPSKAAVDTGALSSSAEQAPDAKFKAAQDKAEKIGVHQLTQEDIEGLNYDQIKQLRGY